MGGKKEHHQQELELDRTTLTFGGKKRKAWARKKELEEKRFYHPRLILNHVFSIWNSCLQLLRSVTDSCCLGHVFLYRVISLFILLRILQYVRKMF